MDSQKDLALFSDVDENVALSFKNHQDEKGQRAIKVDIRHMLNLAPFQKSTEAVMEGIPDGFLTANESRRVEDAKESKIYSQAAPAAPWHCPGLFFPSVPHVGKTSSLEEGAEDEAKTEDKGSYGIKQGMGEILEIEGKTEDKQIRDFGSTPKETSGVKYEESKPSQPVPPVKGFLWKTLTISVLFVILSVAVIVVSGNIFHVQARDSMIRYQLSTGKNRIGQTVNVIPHQVEERSRNEETERMIYKSLKVGEECSAGKQDIQDKCRERVVCVRNRTLKNMVAVCAPNIYMHDFCPVFTLASTNGSTPFPVVQPDSQSQCVNCSYYYLWDVENYPQCLKLEMDVSTTTTTSSSNATSYSAGRDEKGLSGGSIAGIAIGAIIVLAVIIVVVLFFLHRSGHIHIQSERLSQIWGQIRGWVFVIEDSNTEKDTELS